MIRRCGERHGGSADPAVIGVGALLAVLFLAADGIPQEQRDPWLTMTATVHVHSTMSTGQDTLDTLAVRAERWGIDAIVLTDNFLLRFEYGLLPLPGVIRHTVEHPSVMKFGVSRFLSEIRDTNRRHPRVLLIPGVEVIPQYYWTGSVFRKNLTMHDAQKNILVLGLTTDEDYLWLPVAGNAGGYAYGWNPVVLLWPVLLIPPAIWLINHRVDRKIGSGWTSRVVQERRRAPGVVLLGLAVLLLVNNYPFGIPHYDIYRDDNGLRPHQGLIDYVRQRGGISIWSMPEARDFNRFNYGQFGIVTVKTDPYPEALLKTSGYTGFGSVYQDTSTVTDPGGIWDRMLLDYTRGARDRPPWGFGEIAYHKSGSAGIELYQVQNVAWVRQRTPEALLDALANGRMYALTRTEEYGLALKDFSLVSGTSAARAMSGQTLQTAGLDTIQMRVAVETTDRQPHALSLQVVRDGQVLASRTETTPFQWDLSDRAPAAGDGTYYRLLIGSGAHRIVTNPIFVQALPARR